MNLYSKKQRWKIILFLVALLIVASSIVYSKFIVDKIKVDERVRIRIWSEAVKNSYGQIILANQLFDKIKIDEEEKVKGIARAFEQLSKDNIDYDYVLGIIQSNTSIPLILTDNRGVYSSASNLGFDEQDIYTALGGLPHDTSAKSRALLKKAGDMYLDSINKLTRKWSQNHSPIPITFGNQVRNFVYYKESAFYDKLFFRKDSLIKSFNKELINNSALVPVVFIDSATHNIIATNIDTAEIRKKEKKTVEGYIKNMALNSDTIKLRLNKNQTGFIFYEDSEVLTQLQYFPYIQFTIVGIFLLVTYLIFSTFRNAEQNQVWAGMAKETAHQLGTPLSSLMAWNEILRSQGVDETITSEIDKDIERLNTITARFSKIGSEAALEPKVVTEVIEHSVDYLRHRVSDKIKFHVQSNEAQLMAMINPQLFEWVLENICKNAVDAMEGSGSITFEVFKSGKNVIIDITDSGKGIPAGKFKTIFKPGFTTKKRGWGLGLSLVKRIIEEYHKGKIYVLRSEPAQGTTFRIMLKHHSQKIN